jgi:hypothetical protein
VPLAIDSIHFNDFDMRDNVGLITLFFCKQHQQQPGASQKLPSGFRPCIAVANTHILFNPKRGDMKVGRRAPTSSLQRCPVLPALVCHFK